MPREVTRHIRNPVSNVLWGRAAGRCQFAGCNTPLWKSSITQEEVNVAQRAHIWSFSSGGPRGHSGIEISRLNSVDNLMLVCHGCHRKLDKRKDGGRYTAKLLQEWKAGHETRVELVTGVAYSRRSHVLLYGANIGSQVSFLTFDIAASAMFPSRYPAAPQPITLGMTNSAWHDRDPAFWRIEETNLRRQFDEKVRPRVASGDIAHLSVFGFAPQPLLIVLGSLLTDITPVDVYQLRREPQGWTWAAKARATKFVVKRPSEFMGEPALVLSLSATVTADRIERVLGKALSVWTLTLVAPHNDWLQSRDQLRSFRTALRPLLDVIKAQHGQTTLLHVFPAMPVATAIELGRVRMPKADMPWRIYDQVSEREGFVLSVEVGAMRRQKQNRRQS